MKSSTISDSTRYLLTERKMKLNVYSSYQYALPNSKSFSCYACKEDSRGILHHQIFLCIKVIYKSFKA